MDKKQTIKKLEDTVTRVRRNTPEMEALLEVGYQMTKAEAEQIIKERDKDHQAHPYEEYKKAKAFLAAYSTDPIPVSEKAGWKRTPNR